MSERIPKIAFKYAYALDMQCRRKFADEIDDYPEGNEVKEAIVEWQNLWGEINEDDKVLKQIIDLTGVTNQMDITAFIIGGGFLATSTPLLLPVTTTRRIGDNKAKKIELLIHEILHNFVSGHKDYWMMIREKYSDEPIKTQNHIIIYALLEKILDEVLPDVDLRGMISPDWEDYMRALEITRETGADPIIAEFRSFVDTD